MIYALVALQLGPASQFFLIKLMDVFYCLQNIMAIILSIVKLG